MLSLGYNGKHTMMSDVGNPADNIFVTPALVTWGVSAACTKANGLWQLAPYFISGPTPVDSTDFPQWTDVFLSSGF